MSLFPCRICERLLSKTAEQCPGCGENTRIPKSINGIYLFAMLSLDFYSWEVCCMGGWSFTDVEYPMSGPLKQAPQYHAAIVPAASNTGTPTANTKA